MRPPLLVLVVALAFAVFLTPSSRADGLDEILARGKIHIGVCPYPPWTFQDKNGFLAGHEINIGRQIAADLNVEVYFARYTIEDAIAALAGGEIDMIAAGLSITPERALRVEFTNPYQESGTTLVVHRTYAPNVKTLEDIDRQGNVVIVQSETYSEQIAENLLKVATLKRVANTVEAAEQLNSDVAHATLTNLIDADIIYRRYDDKLYMPLEKPITRSVAAFALNPGNYRLMYFLNAWIAANQANGFLEQQWEFWFNDYSWMDRVAEE